MKAVISRAFKILVISFLLLFLKFIPAHATRLQDLSKKQLIGNSDSIIVGKVLEKYADWDPTGRYIYTYVRIQIVEDLKGAEGGEKEILVKQIGGRVGNREMVMEGAPSFKVGEKTLVFLTSDPDGSKQVFGLVLGKFRIIKDGFSGQERIFNPHNPKFFMNEGAAGGFAKTNSTSLDTLKGEIKEELDKTGSN